MHTSPIAGLGLAALITITLAGCEAAEESTQRLKEKAEHAAQELAREALSDTVQTLNKHVDEAQQAAEELLGHGEDEGAADNPEREEPASLPGTRVET
ncbi:MAG: lipoprotein [Pseudomonas sp. BICA1-14]|uniref:hypothetical protein n=1 Tax=Stutzerimonas kunmingensis TaxID=1211807 RepID=UPI0005B38DE6|nr:MULTISPECIES: hypothetical protein [Stutzerimonas stutzeri group]KJS74015.1 MAG: lipoprotein [[Pseudomonas] sp. BICA1-14]HBW08698.1 hypothetical protein [Pseudomonas sp.]